VPPLDSPIPESQLPITLDEAKHKLSTGKWDDRAALSLVLNDTVKAESYEQSKQFVSGWAAAQTIYQSPFTARYWEGTMVARASIPFYTVANAVNSLVPQIINGMFYENPPFLVQERPGTTAQEARAVGAVQAYQLEDIGFREELRLGVRNAVLFGTNIWKWGWESHTRKRKIYKRRKPQVVEKGAIPGSPNIRLHDNEDPFDVEVIEEETGRPFFQHLSNLRYLLVDPTLAVPDIRKAKFVVERMYMTWDELDQLRDQPGFDIPSREKLLEAFLPPKEPVETAIGESTVKNPVWDMRAEDRWKEATTDPFNEPLEVLWRWDNDTNIVVLQKKFVIKNDDNEFGVLPYLSIGWWDVPEAFFSMGLSKTVGSEQMIQQGIVDSWLDCLALWLNPVVLRVQGKSVPTQSIRMSPGKVVNVEAITDMKFMERSSPVPEAGEHVSMSQSRVDQYAGAGALNTTGAAAGHSNLARSATGANMLAGSGTSAPDFVEKLADQVILPFLYAMQDMNNEMLPERTWQNILSDDLQHDYMKTSGDIEKLVNARLKFSILAGAKMAARQKMAQAMPILFQLVGNPAMTEQLTIQGKKVDFLELTHMLFESSEWKNWRDVIVDMTPQDQQRAQQNSPAAKMQMQMQAQQQQAQTQQSNKLDLIDSENQARAGREVLRAALEKASEPEVLSGNPGGQYNPS
jgi:hypothetical protein